MPGTDVEITPTGTATKAGSAVMDFVLGGRQPAAPMPQEVHDAWRDFPAVYGSVRVPTAEKPMTAGDVTAIAAAFESARALMAAAKDTADAATEAYLTHLRLGAEARAAEDPEYAAALAKLPVNGAGHPALGGPGAPLQLAVPGTEMVLSAEYKLGTPQLTVEDVDRLRAEKQITRRQHRALTRTVRVVDTAAVEQAMADDPALGARLRAAFRAAKPSVAVHLRKAKVVKKTTTKKTA